MTAIFKTGSDFKHTWNRSAQFDRQDKELRKIFMFSALGNNQTEKTGLSCCNLNVQK